MSGLKNFLLELRYRPAMCALISVDAYMGIPWQLEGGILYIPFFKLADQRRGRTIVLLFMRKHFESGKKTG